MPGPAATISSMHVCPMVTPGTPPIPHVGGPVTGPGVPTVLIGGKPASVLGDLCICSGPPDTVAVGVANVLIGGKPAATIGSLTAHGGTITVGVPTVLIGTGPGSVKAVLPLKKIPFPKISAIQKTIIKLSGKSVKVALANQQKLRELAEESEEAQAKQEQR